MLFTGQEEIRDEDVLRAEVTNFSTSDKEALTRFGWKGETAGYIGLRLSPDNRRVDAANLKVVGPLEKHEVRIEAKKLWQGVDTGVAITLQLREAEMFNFTEGGMWSDYVEAGNIVHSATITKDGVTTPIMDARRSTYGIGQFSVRMVCIIAKSSSVKKGVMLAYTILMYPAGKDEMLEISEHANSAAWPGIKIAEGEFTLIPRALVNWQNPVVPLILPGTNFQTHPFSPPAEDLRRAIASVMRRCIQPECCKTLNALTKAWERAETCPEEFLEKQGPVTWPTPSEATPAEGKCALLVL
jgi:hypothetical protein